MATKQTLERAYGNIPKEVTFNFCAEITIWRGLKYYYYKLIRKFTR